MAGADWNDLAKKTIEPTEKEYLDYRQANAEMIRKSVRGQGPYATSRSGNGVSVVFNISTAHIPSFVQRSTGSAASPAYMNRYDLNEASRVLGNPPAKPGLRERIDAAVVAAGWKKVRPPARKIYYGALELNGAGIRYFGDACLVLKNSEINNDQPVLYRNSYDLSTKPIVDRIYVPKKPSITKKNAVAELASWIGTWASSVADMVVCKIMDGRTDTRRRLTTGAISQGVLSDEDYIEIPKLGSFNASHVEECRLTSSDAAAEAHITDRLLHGPSPSFAELQWRHRRRVAEHVLETGAVPITVRVVTTVGRDRG
ncbi:hypothetical protein J2W92_000729 [Rhizobium leguminosarum]